MNLKYLLSLGQTFFGIRSVPSPYRLTNENFLPNFGNITHPASIANPAHSEVDGFRSEIPDPQEKTFPTISKFNSHQSTSPKAALSQSGGEGSTGGFGKSRRPAVSSNPFAARKDKNKGARQWIQDELPIAEIQVVRNDLTEDDLEVVEIRKRRMKSIKTTAQRPSVQSAVKWNPFASASTAISK